MKLTIFKNFTQIIDHLPLTDILHQIKNGKYQKQVATLQKLINTGNIGEYNQQKKSLPAFTACGTFIGGRKPQYFKEYSGFVILDFDKLTNNGMQIILERVPLIPYTLCLFKSPSGSGFKILVKVSPPPSTCESVPPPCPQGGGQRVGILQQFHLTAFNQVRKYYEDRLALHVDPSGKDITRLCFFSFDPDLYYNSDASIFNVEIKDCHIEPACPTTDLSEGRVENKKNCQAEPVEAPPTTPDDIENVIKQIETTQLDITSTYDIWLKLGFALVDALGPNARDYYHRISYFNPEYDPVNCNKQFDYCLNSKNSGITIKTFFATAKENGIDIKSKKADNSSPFRGNASNAGKGVGNADTEKQTKNKITGKTKKIATNKFHLVRDYLTDHFDIRYNTVTTEFEYKEKDQEEFKPMNENNIFIKMCLDGLTFSLNNLMAFLKSDLVPRYNPFTRFFESLSPWSGDTDHIQNLATHIKIKSEIRSRFDNHFKKWLVRVVKCSVVDSYFNKQAFILVHDKQNSGKSTFCRFLCPPALSNYIAENLSIDKDSRILLTTNLLINLDELSTLSKFEINSLKSLFSKDKINDRLPYDRRNSIIPRRASFIGSTNQAEFLNDESGSVRWLCFQIDSIDWSYKENINIDDVWAQAFHLFKINFPSDLTAEEIKENEEYNRQFHITTSEFELVQKYFSPATKEAHECFMTATDIVMYLSENTFGRVKLSPINVGKALKMLSFARDKKYPEKIYGYYVTKNIL